MRYANYLFFTDAGDNSKQEALKLYLQLSDQFNHPDAIMQAANMYFRGIGVRKDYVKYIELLTKAADLGVMKACLILGDVYSEGRIVEQDDTKAFEFYKKGSQLGSTICQYHLALMYLDGMGVDKNLENATRWFDCYLDSEMVKHYLAALDIIHNEFVDTDISEEKIINCLKTTYDATAMMSLVDRYTNDQLITMTSEEVEHCYQIMAKMYGRPLNIAYSHYSRRDSNAYNAALALQLNLKRAYLGTPDVLLEIYKQISALQDKTEQLIEVSETYLKLSAAKGHKEAVKIMKKKQYVENNS